MRQQLWKAFVLIAISIFLCTIILATSSESLERKFLGPRIDSDWIARQEQEASSIEQVRNLQSAL